MAANKNLVVTFNDYFQKKLPAIRDILPRHLTPERVAKIAVSALMRNPALLECKPETVWMCVANAAALGLEVNLLGSAYLVPFRNKNGGKDCQLIVGYQGLIDLARRSGNIESIEAHVVYENDDFELEYGLDPKLKHSPCLDADKERGGVKFVYAIARLKDGGTQTEVMTKNEIDGIRARSKAKNFGPWTTDYEEMARKTVVRRLSKYLPKSIEMNQALTIEDAGESGEPQFAGLLPQAEEIAEIPEAKTETETIKDEVKKKRGNKRKKDEEPGDAQNFSQDMIDAAPKHYGGKSIADLTEEEIEGLRDILDAEPAQQELL